MYSRARYHKWNSSSGSPLESPAVLPPSPHCPVCLCSYKLSPQWLPYFFLSPVFSIFSSFALYFSSSSLFLSDLLDFPFPRCFISLSHSSSLINISLTFCDSSFLSVSSLYLCLCVWRDRPLGEPSCLSLPFCPQGEQLWWGLMHYWSLSPLRIYLLMHTWAHVHGYNAAACS